MSKWLEVQNKSSESKTASLLINGSIGYKDWWDDSGVTVNEFIKTVDALGDVNELIIDLNSPGGVVSDGIAIANYLRAHKASISVNVIGQASSIASVVAMAADKGKLHMALGAIMMIHDPWSIVAGNAEELRKLADTLDKHRDAILSFYRERTDLSDDEIKSLMAAETTMTADDAVEKGFADSMDEDLKTAAHADIEQVIAKAKQDFLNRLNSESQHEPIKEGDAMAVEKMPKITAEYLNEHHADVVAEIKAEARKEGAEAENKRIQDVQAQLLPGHQESIQKLMFDGKTTGEQAAIQILAAERAKQKQAGQDLIDDAPEPLPDPVEPMNLTEDEKIQAKWDRDEKIRAEFGKFSTFAAYMKNGGEI